MVVLAAPDMTSIKNVYFAVLIPGVKQLGLRCGCSTGQSMLSLVFHSSDSNDMGISTRDSNPRSFGVRGRRLW